ncbi:hypothetical protein AKO1_011859 [Acrasis kona]|uniref:NBR1 n=1 Tax=Acrasis kona TaxID=1008807 RepID=A0AAW2YN19_9EUKA
MSDTVSLKITINNGSKRRINVENNIPFEELNKQLKEILPTQNDLSWRYIDEENELIDVSTNHEWQLAVKSHPSNAVMRLFVQEIQRPPQQEQQQQQHTCANPNRRCCESRMIRYGLPFFMFWSVLFHPILSVLIAATTGYVTFHHYPSTFQTLTVFARRHYRLAGVFLAISLLLNHSLFTWLLLVPLLVITYKKVVHLRNNHKEQVRERVESFIRQANKVVTEATTVIKDTTEQVIANAIAKANEVPKPNEIPNPAVEAEQVDCRNIEPRVPAEAEMYPSLPVIDVEEQYQAQLATLFELGFKNEKLNTHLLKNYDGNVDRVLNSLLSLSNKYNY